MTFSDHDSQQAWNTAAEAWDVFVEQGGDYYRTELHGPALLAACQPVKDLRVLDLGCGQGYFTRLLARQGATVCGVDLSEELIAKARAYETDAPLGISYYHLSAIAIAEQWPPASFDMVTACMSLQDMADIATVMQAVATLLRSHGRFVFSIPHPCTDTPVRTWETHADGRRGGLTIDRYFASGLYETEWDYPGRVPYCFVTPSWRYTLSEWSVLLDSARLVIRRLHEPQATPELVQRQAAFETASRIPYFLIYDTLLLNR